MRIGNYLLAIGAALAVTLGLVACGGGDSKPKTPTPAQDQAAVRGVLVRLERGTETRDYRGLCSSVLAAELVRKVASAGLPCDVALKVGLGSVKQPRLQVDRVKVTGNRALAEVHSAAEGQQASNDVVQLVREHAGWRVTSLAGPQPPAPAPSDDTP
jgi:hypothetical protein